MSARHGQGGARRTTGRRLRTATGVVIGAIALDFIAPFPGRAYEPELRCAVETPSSTGTIATLSSDARGALDTVSDAATASMCFGLSSSGAPSPEPGRVYFDASRAFAAGRAEEAALGFGEVRASYPMLADRLSIDEGTGFLEAGRFADALVAFDRAAASHDVATVLRAEVGRVRALAKLRSPRAEAALSRLLARYPELPMASRLRLDLAESVESRGERTRAAALYRTLAIEHPAELEGRTAGEKLRALGAAGVRVRPFSMDERITRAEHLVRGGALDEARAETAALRAARLGAPQRTAVAEIDARIAKFEGRFDDALRDARSRGASTRDDPTSAESVREARATIRRLVGAAPSRRTRLPRLLRALDVAATAGLSDTVDRLLESLESRALPSSVRMQAALAAIGIASDERIVSLLAPAAMSRLDAQYHYACALERAGRIPDARRELTALVERSGATYYGIWAKQRLGTLGASRSGGRPPASAGAGERRVAKANAGARAPSTASESTARRFGFVAYDARRTTLDVPATIAELAALARVHGAAYPWLGRAIGWLELGDVARAADELHEVSIAFRDATGRRTHRTGLEVVARGDVRRAVRVDGRTRRERRKLGVDERRALGRIFLALDDAGSAVGLLGPSVASNLHRPYGTELLRAAAAHDVDPHLLWAVMRVESVYERRVVSYAGAIGLMQIMPRTGRLIARARGDERFTPANLLEPSVNLDFAAWYLASLIQRFDGHLPLAIASYNGGPHNVRRWMRDAADGLPLDVFLEHIPFSQTHRYVRRVLTYYAAYRADAGLDVPALDTSLPAVRPDPVAF